MDAALHNLVGAVRRSAPDLVDEWEATAWVESFGWTDDRIQASFGLPTTRALGRHIYLQPREAAELTARAASDPDEDAAAPTEVTTLPGAYSRSFVYAIPWLVLFTVESVWPYALETQPEMAGPISLAVMASLIATGGYVQAIARKASFYLGMYQLALARHVGLLLCRVGLATTAVITVAAIVAGAYFDIFGSAAARAMAAFYFVMLSALWLACAMLSLQSPRWRVPVVYVSAGLFFVLVKTAFDLSTLAAQTAAMVAAVVVASALTAAAFRSASRRDHRTEVLVLPRPPVLLHSLLPHFIYGIAYFAFLFADRLSAGSALPATWGLPFGLALDYKRGIDLAFLVFLIVAGGVEYGIISFMRSWREDAKSRSASAIGDLGDRLARRRTITLWIIVTFFAIAAVIAAAIAGHKEFLTPDATRVFLAGCAGYLLFSVGLFDALLLFSIDRPFAVLRALLPALAVNLIGGYLFSHIAGPEYAAAGLVLGAVLFAVGARRSVDHVLRKPDFAYAWA